MSLRAGGRSEATKPPKYLQLLPGLVRFRLGGQRSRKTAQVPSALAWTCAVPSRGTRKSQNRLSTRSTYFDLSGFVSGNSEAAKPLMHPQRLPRVHLRGSISGDCSITVLRVFVPDKNNVHTGSSRRDLRGFDSGGSIAVLLRSPPGINTEIRITCLVRTPSAPRAVSCDMSEESSAAFAARIA